MASGSFLKAMHSGIHFLKLSYVHQHPNCKSTEGQPTNPKNPCIMEYLHFLGVFAGVLRVCLSVFKVQATHLSLSLYLSLLHGHSILRRQKEAFARGILARSASLRIAGQQMPTDCSQGTFFKSMGWSRLVKDCRATTQVERTRLFDYPI